MATTARTATTAMTSGTSTTVTTTMTAGAAATSAANFKQAMGDTVVNQQREGTFQPLRRQYLRKQ